MSRRVFSLAEFRVSVICCELCVSLESVLQNILLNDCCRRAVCAMTRCFRGCVLLRVSGLLGDLMNYLLRPIAVVVLHPAACAEGDFGGLSGFVPICCAVAHKCAYFCAHVRRCCCLIADSPVPNRFCMTPRFSERFP